MTLLASDLASPEARASGVVRTIVFMCNFEEFGREFQSQRGLYGHQRKAHPDLYHAARIPEPHLSVR